jgi:hypothetical protein
MRDHRFEVATRYGAAGGADVDELATAETLKRGAYGGSI